MRTILIGLFTMACCLLLSCLYVGLTPDVSYSEPLRFGLFKYELPSLVGGNNINPFTEKIPQVGSLGISLVRHPVSWECVEPKKGSFDNKGCKQIRDIDNILSAGIKVQPTIRTAQRKQSKADEFWATGKSSASERKSPSRKSSTSERKSPSRKSSTSGRKIPSRPPLDLTSQWNEKYGYSSSYYEFISGFLDHFCAAGSCSISEIVIENEANSDHYWISTGNPERDVEDYVKIVKTAKKVITDRRLPIKVYDSGIQGWTVPFLAMREAVNRGDFDLADKIYYSVQNKSIRKQELVGIIDKSMGDPAVKKADLMLKSDLYKTVDGLNFHYYQPVESLPYIVDFLRKSIPPGKQLVCNEVGIKGKFLYGGNLTIPDLIVQKTLTMFSLGVNPVIWFSLETQDNVAHVISNNGTKSEENSRAFQKTGRLLEGASAVRRASCNKGSGFVVVKAAGDTKVCFDSPD